jgi:site-specific DNA recombinase
MEDRTKTQLRAIVAKRLSNLTDATTHLVTESESIEEFCRRKNILVVAETEDLDVSGGKPIKERPKIGPWLTLDHLDEWDVLVIYKLDRGFRNHLDFVNFYHEYCEIHGKKIVSVQEDIDMSTPQGRMFAGILVQFAEWELINMSQRRSAAAKVIRRAARWNGGSFAFGYEPYKDGDYWYLRPHPVYAETALWMAEEIISGKPVGWVATELNARGIPTARNVQLILQGKEPKDRKWQTSTVTDLMRSEVIRGYVLQYVNGRHKPPVRVLDSDGEYVRRQPLIDDETWYQLQRALDAAAKPQSGVRSKGSMLLQVAFCGYCGAPMYSGTAGSNGHFPDPLKYYLCRYTRTTCEPSRAVPKLKLEQTVSTALLDAVGDCEMTERRVIAGDDHSQALRKIGMQIADLTTQHFVHGGVPEFYSKMAELQAEHERISSLPKAPAQIRTVATGKTFREWWQEAHDQERHSYLKSAGVTVHVVLAEDIGKIMAFSRTTDAAEDAVLDIPLNIIREFGREPQSRSRVKNFVINISLGSLREQLQRASKAGE